MEATTYNQVEVVSNPTPRVLAFVRKLKERKEERLAALQKQIDNIK